MIMRNVPYSLSSVAVDPDFAHDVVMGLSAPEKHLNSRWFYDAQGSELFRQIMHLDEYYLTRAEYNALDRNKSRIISRFAEGVESFRLLEFGAGDGLKTKVLLREALSLGFNFSYYPIDISRDALSGLTQELQAEMPRLPITPIHADYFQALEDLPFHPGERTVVLFLGSNIGNFTQPEAIRFLTEVQQRLHPGDLMLIGMDLKKDPNRILRAYDDSKGITREFNLNLLRRMNRELGADFDEKSFSHLATYDPVSGETKSFLISRRDQKVHFHKLGFVAHFRAWEPVWLELSQKYDLAMAETLARESGFHIRSHFYDVREEFLNTLWMR